MCVGGMLGLLGGTRRCLLVWRKVETGKLRETCGEVDKEKSFDLVAIMRFGDREGGMNWNEYLKLGDINA